MCCCLSAPSLKISCAAWETMMFCLNYFCTTLVNEDTYDNKSIEANLITTELDVDNASATKIIKLTSENTRIF